MGGDCPSTREEVLAFVLTAGVRTGPSKNTTTAPVAYDVLYDPWAAGGAGEAVDVADLRTTQPSPVRWTDNQPHPGDRRQRQRRHQNHQSDSGPTCRLVSSSEAGPGATVGTLN
jgi:hypothetical protein